MSRTTREIVKKNSWVDINNQNTKFPIRNFDASNSDNEIGIQIGQIWEFEARKGRRGKETKRQQKGKPRFFLTGEGMGGNERVISRVCSTRNLRNEYLYKRYWFLLTSGISRAAIAGRSTRCTSNPRHFRSSANIPRFLPDHHPLSLSVPSVPSVPVSTLESKPSRKPQRNRESFPRIPQDGFLMRRVQI